MKKTFLSGIEIFILFVLLVSGLFISAKNIELGLSNANLKKRVDKLVREIQIEQANLHTLRSLRWLM